MTDEIDKIRNTLGEQLLDAVLDALMVPNDAMIEAAARRMAAIHGVEFQDYVWSREDVSALIRNVMIAAKGAEE